MSRLFTLCALLAACGNDIALGDDDELLPDAATAVTDAGVDPDPDAAPEPAVDAPLVDAPPVTPVAPLAVAVGYGGKRARSTNGATWTNFVEVDHSGGDDNNLLRGVGYGDGIFIAVGGSSTSYITTSTDGITWSPANRSLPAWLGGVAYVGNRFVAAGGNGLRVRSLDRGATWSAGVGYQAVHYRDVASTGTIAVAVGHTYDTTPNVGVIASTTDGVTWTERKRGGQVLDRVVAGNGILVAGGKRGGIVRSANGTTWTDVSLASSGDVYVVWNGSQFVASVGSSYFKSTDGLTWTSSAGTKPLNAFVAGRYVSLAWPATIHASLNLSSWSQVFTPQGSGFTKIAVGVAP